MAWSRWPAPRPAIVYQKPYHEIAGRDGGRWHCVTVEGAKRADGRRYREQHTGDGRREDEMLLAPEPLARVATTTCIGAFSGSPSGRAPKIEIWTLFRVAG